QLGVDGADTGEQAVGRGGLDEIVEAAPPALRGEGERAILGEAARIDERGDVLARGAVAGVAAARDGGGASGVEADRVARADLGEIGADRVEIGGGRRARL